MTIRQLLIIMIISAFGFASYSLSAQESVQELADRWTRAYNSHDKDALSAVYTEDAHLYIHGKPTIEGRDNIETFWADDFEEGNPLTILQVTHKVDGYDMKLVHGNYQVIGREDGGILGGGRFAHIWVLEDDGSWLLHSDLWNQPYEEVEYD